MSTNNIFLLRNRKKYTGSNLKTTKLLDCALIGACAVIRSNMVSFGLKLESFQITASINDAQHMKRTLV